MSADHMDWGRSTSIAPFGQNSTTSKPEVIKSTSNALHQYITNDTLVVEQGQFSYETVAASQTDQALGATGAAGDFLHTLIITVATAATAAVSIKDGSGSAISIMPNSPGGGIGVYVVELNIVSGSGAWQVTTGAGSTVVAVGRFT